MFISTTTHIFHKPFQLTSLSAIKIQLAVTHDATVIVKTIY